MTPSVFQRLFWKEFRQQKTFWLCVAAMALCLLPLAYVGVIRPTTRIQYWFSITAYLPIVFALGSSAMSFAAEREEGTDLLLCRLAPAPSKLFVAKVVFTLLATLLM